MRNVYVAKKKKKELRWENEVRSKIKKAMENGGRNDIRLVSASQTFLRLRCIFKTAMTNQSEEGSRNQEGVGEMKE